MRPADPADADALARLWYDGWQEAHAAILPVELKELRTLASFRERLQAGLPRVRAAGPPGAPFGFCIVTGDQLDQLYVAAPVRRTGVATALLRDAESRMRGDGVVTAWLACAIGNDRAARFYESRGWRLVGTFMYEAETAAGSFRLETWRYEKTLAPQ